MLDRIRSLAAFEAFVPADFAAELAHELPGATTLIDLASRDATFVTALQAIDELAARVMRLHIDDIAPGMPMPTRRVFASTIVSYRDKLDVLADRVRATGADPAPIVEAARATLAVRDATRDAVLALVRERAMTSIREADERARDVKLDDAQRKQWSRARRDLEAIANEPAQILAAPMATRMAAWDDQLDEPAAKPEPTLAELIELD
jgi:hypothetical protein